MINFKISAFAFLLFSYLTAPRAYAEFAYKQYPEEFARKILPTPQKKKVSWGEVTDVTRVCISDLMENIMRSIYLKPKSKIVFDKDWTHISMAQNGGSYGAYFGGGRMHFEDNPQTKYTFYLHQSPILTREFNDENGNRIPFYYNGPFGFTVIEQRDNTPLMMRLNLKPFISPFQQRINDEDALTNWGFEQALPILFADLEDKGAGMTGEDMSFDRSKVFDELYLFEPFYLKDEIQHFYIGHEATPYAYNRKEFSQCLLKVVE